ncbi:MAG: CDP-alcohol phosphatidyltransferase family protein [Aquificaceae bacterium]
MPINPPDLLSLSRILIAPLFAYTLFRGHLFVSLFLFLFGAFSDLLDGFLARRIGRGKYGYILDPIGDRILIGISLLSLHCVPLDKDISLLLVLFVVGQDLLLFPIGFYVSLLAIRRGNTLKASPLGKLTTLAQYSFVLYILGINLLGIDTYVRPFELFVILTSIASGVHHLYIWLRILRQKA